LLNFPIERFGPQHDRPTFSCGNEPLDRYFHERIRKDLEAKVAAAYVLTDGPAVLDYYTLSAHSVERDVLPEEVVSKLKLPKYPLLPVTLMGRLAVDRKYHCEGLGEILLLNVVERIYVHSSQIASFAFVVDAKESAVQFYGKYGFLKLPKGERSPYLKISRILPKMPFFLGWPALSALAPSAGAAGSSPDAAGSVDARRTLAGLSPGGGLGESQPAICIAPPPCKLQDSTGCDPSIKYSVFTCGHEAVANSPDSGSICTLVTPAGGDHSLTFL
jgi:hypothetical protein